MREGGKSTLIYFSDTFFLKCLFSVLYIIYSSMRYTEKIIQKVQVGKEKTLPLFLPFITLQELASLI